MKASAKFATIAAALSLALIGSYLLIHLLGFKPDNDAIATDQLPERIQPQPDKPSLQEPEETTPKPGFLDTEYDYPSLTLEEWAALAREYAATNPLGGLGWIDGVEGLSSEQVDAFMSALFIAWSELNPAAACEHILNTPIYDNYLYAALGVWAHNEPHGAASRFRALLDEGKASTYPHHMLDHVVSIWAQSNPQEALNWLGTQGELEHLELYLSSLSKSMAQQDPEGAFALGAQFEVGSIERNAVENSALSQWAEDNPTSAAEWISEQIPAERLGALEAGIREVSSGLFDANPGPTALDWVDTLEDTNIRSAAMGDIQHTWSANGDTKLLDHYKQKLADGDTLYGEHLADVALEMSLHDAYKVGEWLNQQDEFNNATDQVIHGLITQTSRWAPEDAYKWTQKIRDPEVRDAANRIIHRNWAEFKPKSFVAWAETIDTTILSEAMQARLNELKAK